MSMGETAENVADKYGVTREEMDRYALQSHQRAVLATKDGIFAREIIPVPLASGITMTGDDGPRPDTTLERLAGLRPVFREGGRVTAGNSCPLNDGAAAAVVMSRARAEELGITPLARIVATGVSALEPEMMGLGPIESTRQALAPGRDDHRRRGRRGDQRGVRRAGHPVGPRASAWTRSATSSTRTAAPSRSATRSA